MEPINPITHLHSSSDADFRVPVSGRKKALLITVQNNGVEGFATLSHAHHDARDLRRLLIEHFGYPEEDVVLMMDHKECISQELGPTKTQIRKQIHHFVQGVSPGDHLFFYYSGHGSQVPCTHHTESDGLDEEIWTCDGKEIMDNDLKKWLVDPLPHGCKLFALWDSCHSQTILDLDHYICNEPSLSNGQYIRRRLDSGSPLWRVLPKRFRKYGVAPTQWSAFTISAYEHRGRPVARDSVPFNTLSAGNSPRRSKWTPFFMENIQRVLSPLSWFKCDGKCSFPTESDTLEFAHVISLSACKDSESAFDDIYNGTVTKFFIEHMSKVPSKRVVTVYLLLTQGEKPKSTLRELLLAIRQRVDEITAARRVYDMRNGVISRRSTFASGRKFKTTGIPRVIRRRTEINANTLEELLQFTSSSVLDESTKEYSQKPCYSSHYRLNLDEPIDL